MRRVVFLVTVYQLVMAIPAVCAESGGEFHLRGTWWQQPAKPTRHTTLVASFDGNTMDADAAREDRRAGGFGMKGGIPGRHGQAVAIAEMGGHLHYRGGSNINLHHGTIRLAVRGAVWQDETPRWLFEARGRDRIGICRERERLSLVVSEGRSSRAFSQLDLPLGTVSPDAWHVVVASWDRATGQGWIALDGRAISGKLTFPPRHDPAFVIYFGGGFGGRLGGLNEPGLEMDDVVLYDQPLPLLEAEPRPLPEADATFLPRAEEGARKTLYFLAGLQRWGGWQTLYTWPTLIGCSAQGREWAEADDQIGNDKSHNTPYIAARFLYAYEILGDERFLDVALRTAEMLLAGQSPKGYWHAYYRMTVRGIQPDSSDTQVKLQDSVQSHPLFFLAYVHRLTGEERYLEAVKRAGEFYLAAQNPNGSWSHHWDAPAGIGKTATGKPQGGEINDLCTNDAIDVMVFLYHLTGDARYLQAVKRAGEWLIQAQLKGATVGWAEQYDQENHPEWARDFEPPAWCATATQLACQALVEVYRLSGDERYLKPIRDCLAWLEQRFGEGENFFYLDPKTGRPIAAWRREIYFLDEPGALERLAKEPIGIWSISKVRTAAAVRRLLERAKPPASVAPEVTPEEAAARLPALRAEAERALQTQNEAGVWVTPIVANFMGSIGAGFSTLSPPLLSILRYIEAARMAMGEIPPVWRGDGQILRLACPKGDWYQVPWPQD